jgi:pimeloyl-ACP methyl ester carboxylesterase
VIVRSSDGVDVVVHDISPPRRGDDRPITVLACHATGFHGRCYAPLAQRLRAPVRVVAPDLRGHGLTAVPAGWHVDWSGYTDDVVAVAEELPGPVVGFGHSMGGACLLLAARRRPELFRSFVLYEPIAFPPPSDDVPTNGAALAALARRRRPSFDSVDDALANFAAKPPMASFDPGALRAYVDGAFAPADPPGHGVRLRCAPEHEAATFEAGLHSGAWAVLPEVATPTLVLAGDRRSGPPAAIAGPIARRLLRATLRELPELDHFGPMTVPDVVAAIVDEAIDGG